MHTNDGTGIADGSTTETWEGHQSSHSSETDWRLGYDIRPKLAEQGIIVLFGIQSSWNIFGPIQWLPQIESCSLIGTFSVLLSQFEFCS